MKPRKSKLTHVSEIEPVKTLSKLAKHTRGPWTYSHTGEHTNGRFRIDTEDGIFIAGTSYCTHGAEADIIEPDAALIAAAPELLEVVATIYTLANLQPLLETKYSKALVNDIMRQLQVALDKAKGGAK